MKKFLILLLAFVMLCTSLVGCGDSEGPSTGEVDPNHNTVAVLTDKDLVVNGVSDYVIVLPAQPTDYERTAAGEFASYIMQSSGAKLSTITEDETTIPTNSSKYVFIGKTTAGLALNEDFTDEKLTQDGFKIVTKDNNYYILGGTRFGSVYAVYELLYHLIGWDCFSADEIYFEESTTIKFMDVSSTEIPDFEYRVSGNIGTYNDTTVAMRMRYIRAHTHGFAYIYNQNEDVANVGETIKLIMQAKPTAYADKAQELADSVKVEFESKKAQLTQDELNEVILSVLPEKDLTEALTEQEQEIVDAKLLFIFEEQAKQPVYEQTKEAILAEYLDDEDGLKELILQAVTLEDPDLNKLIRENDTSVLTETSKQMLLNVLWNKIYQIEQAEIDEKLNSEVKRWLTSSELKTVIKSVLTNIDDTYYEALIKGEKTEELLEEGTQVDKLREAIWAKVRENCEKTATGGAVQRMYHNCFSYLPASVYNNPSLYSEDPELNLYHPDWYSALQYSADSSGYYRQLQLCYNAHGNKEEYQNMLNISVEVFIDAIKKSPTVDNFQFTQEDNTFWCTCSACQKDLEVYGSNSASVIRFLNDLYALYKTRAEAEGLADRQVNLLFFAYHATNNAPVNRSLTGEVSLVKTEEFPNGLKLDTNVYVFYAPIYMDYTVSMYHEKNVGWLEFFENWSAVSENLYVWYYGANFQNFLIPYGNFSALQENYQIAKSFGAVYFFDEGQHYSTTPKPGGFTYLKEYLSSKLMWNVNANVGELTDKFFENYFKDAGPAMRKYYDELLLVCDYMQYVGGISGSIYEDVLNTKYWKEGTLRNWLNYIDEAYEAIAPLKETDAKLYNKLAERIKIESIAPRYLYIELYLSSDTSEEVMAMKRSVKQDLQAWSWGEIGSGQSPDGLWSKWGV